MTDAPSTRNAPVWATILLVLIAIVLAVIAVIYFTEPASKLPAFFPGHAAGSDHHHTKHGIAAAIVAVAALAGAWLSSGTKKSA